MFVYLWIKEQSRQAVIAHKPADSAHYVSGFLVKCCPPDKLELINVSVASYNKKFPRNLGILVFSW